MTLIPVVFFVGCWTPRRAQSRLQLPGFHQGIINGTPVDKADPFFAMTARILQKDGGTWVPICTASILARDLILTAAHCVDGSSANDIRIAFGAQPLTYEGQQHSATEVDVEARFQTVAVKSFETNPLYGKTDYDDDMALLRLVTSVPGGFHSVALLDESQVKQIDEKKNYPVTLVGYGMLKENPATESDILRQTTVPARFEGLHLITDQTGGSGGCNGDSGGPAYLQIGKDFYLVGVTHGPTVDALDCHHHGVWGNPSREKAFLNKASEKMGSSVRF